MKKILLTRYVNNTNHSNSGVTPHRTIPPTFAFQRMHTKINTTMYKTFLLVLVSAALLGGCKSTQKTGIKPGMNKTEKGAVVGVGSGAVIGGIIGNKSNNAALGAILGAVAGGAVGAVIGNKMDKQAEEMEAALGNTATVERVGEGIKLTFDSQLLFDFGKATVMQSNKDDLQKLAATLREYPETELLIVGHTDDVGSDSFNKTLSRKRATAVSDELSDAGISNSRMNTTGMGESQPAVTNDTEAGRAQNRRVEIAIYANEKMKADAKQEAGN